MRILGATAHPTHAWVTQALRNFLVGLEDAGSLARVRFLIRDRDGKYPALIDGMLGGAGIAAILTGIRVPRMNAIMERWVKTLRGELLDRTLIWNEASGTRCKRTSSTTTGTAPTDPSPPQHPCEPDSNPSDLTGSNASRYSDGIASVSPPRVSACRLACVDVIFGTHKVKPSVRVLAPRGSDELHRNAIDSPSCRRVSQLRAAGFGEPTHFPSFRNRCSIR
ncbi:hypothetical protein [Lentzea albidocapillata]|uniref:hypothetical protein n=1 Tax=Lentzea albidocapillata TaxID=40571 RepID=UPI001B804BE9|nr:hypothetical protein [Lentzea albidocapillata]